MDLTLLSLSIKVFEFEFEFWSCVVFVTGADFVLLWSCVVPVPVFVFL